MECPRIKNKTLNGVQETKTNKTPKEYQDLALEELFGFKVSVILGKSVNGLIIIVGI